MSDPLLTSCPFCSLTPERLLSENTRARWILDGYPVSDGHSLIMPKRHVSSFFETTQEERHDLLALLDLAQARLKTDRHPAGFNIGINDGAAAGQTVPHLHIHLIPRYSNETGDPRGGVRWVVPAKAKYWSD